MEAYFENITEFPIYYNDKERISSMRFSPLFLNNLKYRSLLTLQLINSQNERK